MSRTLFIHTINDVIIEKISLEANLYEVRATYNKRSALHIT
ncbi:MAG: hypothetical protein SOZ71_10910 [Clostridium sp.]|nr:hypothetical protein [Clostridium sp.]